MGRQEFPERARLVKAYIVLVTLLLATSLSIARALPLLRPAAHFTSFTLKRLPKSLPCPLWSSFTFCLREHHKSTSLTLPSTSFYFMASDITIAVGDDLAQNPLLQDFVFPPFDAVQAKHVRPAIRVLLSSIEEDLVRLEQTVEPAWPKLVESLEKIIDRLSVVWAIVEHLKAVKDSADLRAAIEEVQPERVKFQLRLRQSKPLFDACNTIKKSPTWQTLTDAHKRVVEEQIKEAILNGVSLDDDKKDEFNKVEQELEKLFQKFSENVLDASKKYEKLITDAKEIEGLPATTLGLAAQTAASKGHENATAENGPWIITLDAPSFISVMRHARNRSLREEVYRAYVTCASSGDLDNTPVIEQILTRRLEKAKLLGYNNYLEVSMTMKMTTVDGGEHPKKLQSASDSVKQHLDRLQRASWGPAVQDMEDLKNFAKAQEAQEADNLTHWDIEFWSERLREEKYGIKDEELRPFFSLPKVMDGLFDLAKKLFDISIEPADGSAPVWDKDVRFYCVKDSLNKPIAYLYFDPYSRPSEKRGGLWMNEVVGRSRVLAHDGASLRLPVAHMICNQTPPVGDKPCLMTFREVETVFRKIGHFLQRMLTMENKVLVSGIRCIGRDAVELPSQFMENWCYHSDTLMGIAKHYETGETLPKDIYSHLCAARNFRAGSLSLCQIRFAIVDLELHTKYIPNGQETVYDVDRRVSRRTQVIPPLPEDRFLCSFSHIFAGASYAAGYYCHRVSFTVPCITVDDNDPNCVLRCSDNEIVGVPKRYLQQFEALYIVENNPASEILVSEISSDIIRLALKYCPFYIADQQLTKMKYRFEETEKLYKQERLALEKLDNIEDEEIKWVFCTKMEKFYKQEWCQSSQAQSDEVDKVLDEYMQLDYETLVKLHNAASVLNCLTLSQLVEFVIVIKINRRLNQMDLEEKASIIAAMDHVWIMSKTCACELLSLKNCC